VGSGAFASPSAEQSLGRLYLAAELVALIAGQIVASRGDSSAPAISEAVEAAVRIVDAAEAAVAAHHGTGR
jgi:hypothetical protein